MSTASRRTNTTKSNTRPIHVSNSLPLGMNMNALAIGGVSANTVGNAADKQVKQPLSGGAASSAQAKSALQQQQSQRRVTLPTHNKIVIAPVTAATVQHSSSSSAPSSTSSSARIRSTASSTSLSSRTPVGGTRRTTATTSTTSTSSTTSSSSKPKSAPSAALIAAALQNQFMSSIKTYNPSSTSSVASATAASSALALSRARQKAATTLSQSLGLLPPTQPKLTQEQWTEVHERAKERRIQEDGTAASHGSRTTHHHHNQATTDECPICCEEFRDTPQVLLSCSHIFHRTCLASFERFSGTKVCPICREKEYQKKVIHDSSEVWKVKCAVRIQTQWRRYRVRKQYLIMLQTIPPRDITKRKDFFFRRLQATSVKLEKLIEDRDQAIDAMFAECDRNVERVKEGLCAAAIQLKTFTPSEWTAIRAQADERKVNECPICCGEFETQYDGATSSSSSAASTSQTTAASQHQQPHSSSSSYDTLHKRTILLSCSHVYHHGCLLSYERFTLQGGATSGSMSNNKEDDILTRQQAYLETLDVGAPARNDSSTAPLLQPPPGCTCPLCRSNYQKAWY